MAKQMRIPIETFSLLILQGWAFRHAWGPQCGAERGRDRSRRLGTIPNLQRPRVEELLNSNGLHHSQIADGSQLTCLNSLLTCVRNAKSS